MKPQITIGDSPLLLAQPHGGTKIPSDIYLRLNANGRAKADTDWHITQLYDALINNVTVVATSIHRYVVDANRNPTDESLYPGQNTTGLCPTTTFDGLPIYETSMEPDSAEIQQRQQLYHQPYHDSLQTQLDRLHQKHGYVILYDCHSIRSEVPYLFDGRLPDFNIGTNNGETCDAKIQSTIESICLHQPEYSSVSNGRFKGGWTTRHYGKPETGYHALQMELAQCNYMQELAPWRYIPEKADQLRQVLRKILLALRVYS